MGKDDVLYRYVPLKRSDRELVRTYLEAEVAMDYTEDVASQRMFNDVSYDTVIFTVATKLDREAGTVHYGWAVQAPGDRHNKSMARTIAGGRLEKHPVIVTHDPEKRLVDQFIEFVYGNSDEVFGPYRRTLRSVAQDFMADGNIAVSASLLESDLELNTKDNK